MRRIVPVIAACLLLPVCASSEDAGVPASQPGASAAAASAPASAPTSAPASAPTSGPVSLQLAGERHLRNIRQLTFGGENAEAYFNYAGTRLVFQASPPGVECDRIYTMNADGSDVQQISSGEGATTCAYIHPRTNDIYYASTHLGGAACPPKPDFSRGYVWALYKSYDIFLRKAATGELLRLTDTPGYDAEATVSPDGSMVVFTSVRDGDLELYLMDADGSNQRRVTHAPGYDGGAFFSFDNTRLVYRASRPQGEALEEYRQLLAEGLIRPTQLEIYTCNVDGSDVRQITHNGAANFGPYFHPDGKRIIFISNMHDPKGRNFDLFTINDDGTGLEQITFNPTFDGFPMFTHDGKTLVFASNRNNAQRGDTNVFIADWVE